jgi:hypothetical protein
MNGPTLVAAVLIASVALGVAAGSVLAAPCSCICGVPNVD